MTDLELIFSMLGEAPRLKSPATATLKASRKTNRLPMPAAAWLATPAVNWKRKADAKSSRMRTI